MTGMVLTTSCQSQKTVAQGQDKKTELEKALEESNRAEASELGSMIKAELISVGELKAEYGNDPCGKSPCYATIKVKKVIRQGVFPGAETIKKGLETEVKFPITLEPTTQERFPNLKVHYPGLKVGDQFKARIKTVPGNGENHTYQILHYEKLTD